MMCYIPFKGMLRLVYWRTQTAPFPAAEMTSIVSVIRNSAVMYCILLTIWGWLC